MGGQVTFGGQTVVSVFIPTVNQMAFLFSLIVIGYILARLKIVPENASGVLAKLENTIFIPGLVLGTFIQHFTLERIGTAWKLFLGSFIIMIAVIPLSILVSKLCAKDRYTQKIYTYGLSFSNFGFMGNAIVSAIFPHIFLEYLIFTLPLWILIYMWGVPSLLISDGSKQTLGQKVKSFVNPMFVCMIIGMIVGIFNIPIPTWATSVITTAGNCMSPIAMLLTGMTVAAISLKKVFTNAGVWAVTVVRLAVFPLIFIGIFALIQLPNEYDTFVICAICSLAMPLGLNTIVIPSAYGRDTTVASSMALVSHLASCVSIPLIFMLLMEII